MEIIKGKLYRSKDFGVIVMAEQILKENTFSGQVVVDGDYSRGHFSKIWAISQFEPYSAEIILKEVIDFGKVQFLEMNDGKIVLTDGIEGKTGFVGTYLSKIFFQSFEKLDIKRVVTAKFE